MRITTKIVFAAVLMLSSAVVSESRAADQSGHPQPRHVVVPSPAYPTIQRGLVIYGGAKPSAINTCVFSNNNVFGVLLLQAGDVTVDTVSVNDTAVRLDDGMGGGGLYAVLSGPVNITNCFIQTSIIGIANFGSLTTVANTTLACNLISLDGEEENGVAPQFDFLGGNQCSEVDLNDLQCKPRACQVKSSMLAPPTPVAP